ncbi:MAG: DUF6687 family protein, partial [Actinomycetota bacterium]
MRPLRFVPSDQAVDTPNVVVDGSPNAGTRLTLSHWPGSPTPPDLRDDLSAQIAFHALARPELFDGIDVVTNNHFDQDGLASVFTLVNPESARPRRDLLIDVARAGDFGTFGSRDAARIAMTIAALDDDERTPMADLPDAYGERCGALYEWALPRLTDVLDHPERWRDLWADEDDHLSASLLAIESGAVRVHELADVAVFTFGDRPAQPSTRFTIASGEALHPMSLYRTTDRLLVALVRGHRYQLECRYETWVMLTSRMVTPRRDLRILAATLDSLETSGARWHADAPSALTPLLHLADDHESAWNRPSGWRRCSTSWPPHHSPGTRSHRRSHPGEVWGQARRHRPQGFARRIRAGPLGSHHRRPQGDGRTGLLPQHGRAGTMPTHRERHRGLGAGGQPVDLEVGALPAG